MPSYDYTCNKCNYSFSKILKINDRKQPEEAPCPECGEIAVEQRLLDAPCIADPVRIGVRKQDSGFKEVLSSIHQRNRGSKIDTYL